MNNIKICITGDVDTGEKENIQRLKAYFNVLDKYNVKATFPVTARAVEDYPERIEYIVKRGHEIAGHGDVHKEFYGPVFKQVDRLKKMIKIINDILGVEVKGFRAPWYKHNKNTYIALSKVGLQYDSSQKRFEIAIKGIPYIEKRYTDLKYHNLIKPALIKIAQLYNFVLKRKRIPYYVADGVLEIPVLGISDYFLIESLKGPRYTPENSIKIGEIWLENLKCLERSGGGVLTLQAHPGRMSPDYVVALDYFIKNALKSGATFETLSSIAFEFSNQQKGDV